MTRPAAKTGIHRPDRGNEWGFGRGGAEASRLAVEKHPSDAVAWIGLAISYDRLRRFDLTDWACGQAVGIVGPTVEILNNQGFSYMLRGNYKRAHAALAAAQRKDPTMGYWRTRVASTTITHHPA